MYSLLIKPRAILITKDAYDWYEAQKPGLGEEFLSELDDIYQKIKSHPEYFAKAGLLGFVPIVGILCHEDGTGLYKQWVH